MMKMFLFRVLVMCCLGLSTNQAMCEGVVDEARKILKTAMVAGHGDIRISGKVLSPTPLWRESYNRSGDFEWDVYYQLSADGKKGELFEKQVLYYRDKDVYFIFFLDEEGNLIKFKKKIPNTTLLYLKNDGLELRSNWFVMFDARGEMLGINENALLIDDKKKEAHFTYSSVDENGDLKLLGSGDFDYFQLER